jgi:hypothetical protein
MEFVKCGVAVCNLGGTGNFKGREKKRALGVATLSILYIYIGPAAR